MARGYFRTSDKVCVCCGKTYTDPDSGKRLPMPYVSGKGANKFYLCQKCGEKDPDAKKHTIK